MLEYIIEDIARELPIPTQVNTAVDAVYLLASEDGDLIVTEDDEDFINMKTTWI